MIATVSLNPCMDNHILVTRLVKNDVNRAISMTRRAGGKGVNVSKVVRELGGPTHAYAPAGGFVGRLWAQDMKKLRIPFTAYHVAAETRLNIMITDSRDKTQTRINTPGPLISRKDQNAFLQLLLKTRRKPFCWVLSGSPSTGMKPEIYNRYIHALQRAGTPCVLDADDEALRYGTQAKPFMIKPNEHEMQRLAKRTLRTVAEYRDAALECVGMGIRLVVVSLGANGALFVTHTESFYVRGVPVPVKSALGAGDALVGGLMLGIFRKMSLERAAALGVAASASAVKREAPRLCLRKDIPGFLKKIRIRRF